MKQAILALAALALAACDSLPASGPTAREISIAAGSGPEAPAVPGFRLVEVDETIIARMEGWPRPDLGDVFPGDGAGPSFVIDTGDVVQVTIWESLTAGLSGGLFISNPTGNTGAAPVSLPPQVIGPDGEITVPFAGRVNVRGRTPEQVERTIVSRLEGKAISPQAIVSVRKPASNQVTVLGDAAAGGVVALAPGAERITEVIAATGGVSAQLDQIKVTLTRDGKAATLPLVTLFEDPSQNLRLSPGDMLTVSQEPNSFIAVGATGVNARREFGAKDYYLSDAMGVIGGVQDSRGDPAGVYVMRMEDAAFAATALGAEAAGAATPVAYHFDLDQADTFFLTRRFRMRDRDIIYVANAPSVELTKLLDIFRSASTSLLVIDRVEQR